jgi:hypothetical protein
MEEHEPPMNPHAGMTPEKLDEIGRYHATVDAVQWLLDWLLDADEIDWADVAEIIMEVIEAADVYIPPEEHTLH